MTASVPGHGADERLSLLTNWVEQHLPETVLQIEPASADASFRRYFRVFHKRGSHIAMDSPPEREALDRFIDLASRLRRSGLKAPRVLAADVSSGFALLSDLGRATYLDILEESPERADALYGDAIHRLVTLQLRVDPVDLPDYDETLLRTELGIFEEWLLERHLGLALGADERALWETACDRLVASALEQPKVCVHRDYHSRNLMVGSAGDPGVLDFQDAVRGPLTYDLVSLLRDCYHVLGTEQLTRYRQWYLDLAGQTVLANHLPDAAVFARWFDRMGAQRHLKAAGIFARLNHRDGKPGYLPDIPRTLNYVVALNDSELAGLSDWLSRRVVPALPAT
ncbi:MAG: phosphotransferase [Pseudomonadota bacterium]